RTKPRDDTADRNVFGDRLGRYGTCGRRGRCLVGHRRRTGFVGTVITGGRNLDRLTLDDEIARALRTVSAEVVGKAVDRMAAPVEAEGFLLEIQLVNLGPRQDVGKWNDRRTGHAVIGPEQIEVALTEFLVPLRARAVLTGAVDGGKQSRTCSTSTRQRVTRAGLHERLEDALVGDAEIEDLAQCVERGDTPFELHARVDEGVNGRLAEALERREPEPDAFAFLNGEMQLAFVDIRRQHGDATIAALGQIHRELVGVLRFDR